VATQTDEIVVKFSTAGGQEVADTFRRTADASDHFHQKITKAGGALDGLRQKSEARVANNLGAIAQALAGGANAGDLLAISITKVAESFRGSLLFAGAATVGAGLYQGITKIGEAIISLENDLAGLRRQSGVRGDFLGTDQINKNLDLTISRINQLRQASVSSDLLSGQLSKAANLMAGNPIVAAFLGAGGFAAGKVSDYEKAKEKQFREEGIKALGQLGDKQDSLNDAVREGLTGDEKKAALAKEEADHKEKAFALSARAAAVGASPEMAQGLLSQEQSFTNYRAAAIEKQFGLQEKGFQLQRGIIGIEKELLPPAEENLKILDARIAGTKDILEHNHLLTDQEREQYHLQLGQLEATKQRAQFVRQLERDLAGLELGRVRGGVGSNRARILGLQRAADQESAQDPNSPESQRAEAGLEDEQFRQFQDYEKDPGAFRQRRINEQHERNRFQYLRASGQLPDEIASYSDSNIGSADEQRRRERQVIKGGSAGTNKILLDMLKLHQGFAKKVDVG
jgi:hypothetical protein